MGGGGVEFYQFLDLSKAFNCVNHDILRTKLGKLGITGQCGQWLIEIVALNLTAKSLIMGYRKVPY